ncbi:hypothetical protein K1719_036068 [Acacia pycnantha]|nr:hypothetical protein K1719_036068 [Acacia pycnantha]
MKLPESIHSNDEAEIPNTIEESTPSRETVHTDSHDYIIEDFFFFAQISLKIMIIHCRNSQHQLIEKQKGRHLRMICQSYRGIHVEFNQTLYPLSVAKILRALVVVEAIDDDCNQTGQMIAGLLNWPQGTFASKVVQTSARVGCERAVHLGEEENFEAIQVKREKVKEEVEKVIPNVHSESNG